jgi:magnesium transporter
MDKHYLKLLSYNEEVIIENEMTDSDFSATKAVGQIHWIDISDLECKDTIEKMAESYGIHHLIVEDILNTNEMVKMDNYDDCLFIVLKMLNYNKDDDNITTEHVSVVLKGNCVFSFQECGNDIFERIRGKIHNSKDNIRKLGADYLCYELVDTVVDNYFSLIDVLSDLTDEIEEELISKPEKRTLQRIYFVKRNLMYLRKSVFPLRELIGNLCGAEAGQISGDTRMYFHDVYDHLIQIVDSIETYQDILSNMLDIYLSSISNKTNETMKILTIISTIFIPLTFIAGIYGMNFKNIPELGFRYGYLVFWIISLIIVLCMLMFFHKKKWF